MAMSGVTLADDVIPTLNALRLKKSRYVVMTIGNEGKNIVVTSIGDRSEPYNYETFVSMIATDDPCYAAFDFEYEDGGVTKDKLLLIQWISDNAKPRNKMLYSASRDALNAAAQGYLPIQANDISSLEKTEVIRSIKSHRVS